MPLLFFLHGKGERGKSDGSDVHLVHKHGPWDCEGASSFFILAPQCPIGQVWPALVPQLKFVLEHVCAGHNVDKNRVYVTGLSMGGFGAWAFAKSHPHMVAALVSVCGGVVDKVESAETDDKVASRDRRQISRLRKCQPCSARFGRNIMRRVCDLIASGPSPIGTGVLGMHRVLRCHSTGACSPDVENGHRDILLIHCKYEKQ